MSINNRIKEVRNSFGLNQTDFGAKIGLKQSSLGQIETGVRDASDRVVLLMCEKYGVSEPWLRTGEGEMFAKGELFSLDDYARSSGLSPLETKIIKTYMELPKDVRGMIVERFKKAISEEDEIDQEVEDYRRELEDEKRDMETLSASRSSEEA